MKATTCHRCGVKVWRGLDGDTLAFAAVVEVTPLTITGEAMAILSGRRTYAVDQPNRRNARRIWRRWSHQIGKPDGMGATLHAAHHCDAPIPAEWIAETVTATSTMPDPEGVPF